MAKIDLIDPSVNLLLIDCELRRVEGFREAYVRIPDLTVFFRYFLEPGFSGEFDFAAALSQVHLAVCRYLALPVDADTSSGAILFDFLVSPQWKEWIEAHRTIVSPIDAIKSYMQRGSGE